MPHDYKFGLKEKPSLDQGDRVIIQSAGNDIENVPTDELTGVTGDVVINGTTLTFVDGILISHA